MTGVGDDFTHISLKTALCLVRRWIHAQASVYGGSRKHSVHFPRERAHGSWLTSL